MSMLKHTRRACLKSSHTSRPALAQPLLGVPLNFSSFLRRGRHCSSLYIHSESAFSHSFQASAAVPHLTLTMAGPSRASRFEGVKDLWYARVFLPSTDPQLPPQHRRRHHPRNTPRTIPRLAPIHLPFIHRTRLGQPTLLFPNQRRWVSPRLCRRIPPISSRR